MLSKGVFIRICIRSNGTYKYSSGHLVLYIWCLLLISVVWTSIVCKSSLIRKPENNIFLFILRDEITKFVTLSNDFERGYFGIRWNEKIALYGQCNVCSDKVIFTICILWTKPKMLMKCMFYSWTNDLNSVISARFGDLRTHYQLDLFFPSVYCKYMINTLKHYLFHIAYFPEVPVSALGFAVGQYRPRVFYKWLYVELYQLYYRWIIWISSYDNKYSFRCFKIAYFTF